MEIPVQNWLIVITGATELAGILLILYHIYHTRKLVVEQNKQFSRVVEVVDELERDKLLHFLEVTAANAKESLVHYTYTFHTPNEEREMGPLLAAVKRCQVATEKKRFLGPDYDHDLDRLYSRHEAGACVRVNSEIANSDLRFQIADGQHVVITIGAASEKSRKGFLIESVYLAKILTDWFDTQWSESIDYDLHVKKEVKKAGSSAIIHDINEERRIEYIADHLRLKETEVRRVWDIVKNEAVAALAKQEQLAQNAAHDGENHSL